MKFCSGVSDASGYLTNFAMMGKFRKPRPLSVKEIRYVNGISDTPHFRKLYSFLIGGSASETRMFRDEIRSVLLLLCFLFANSKL